MLGFWLHCNAINGKISSKLHICWYKNKYDIKHWQLPRYQPWWHWQSAVSHFNLYVCLFVIYPFLPGEVSFAIMCVPVCGCVWVYSASCHRVSGSLCPQGLWQLQLALVPGTSCMATTQKEIVQDTVRTGAKKKSKVQVSNLSRPSQKLCTIFPNPSAYGIPYEFG